MKVDLCSSTASAALLPHTDRTEHGDIVASVWFKREGGQWLRAVKRVPDHRGAFAFFNGFPPDALLYHRQIELRVSER